MAGASRSPKPDGRGGALKYKGWEIHPISSFNPRLGWIPKVDIVRRSRTSVVHRSLSPSDPAVRFQSLEDAILYAVALGRVAIDHNARRPTRRRSKSPRKPA